MIGAMIKQVKAAKFPPSLPPRPSPSSSLEESGTGDHNAFAFPPHHRLIITTMKGVYSWDILGVAEIFRSGSEGIVAAKKLKSEKDMLAIADSQVVVLHEVKGGTQKSYRLKGSEGRVRLLKYAKESNNLFFTTTLQNSVQSYSLQASKFLNPSHDHPSPPAIFAISCNSRFLVSTSTAPPTIHLTDLSVNMSPILIRPECSASAVIAATFHPERECHFFLAFADRTGAVFDASHFFRKYDQKEHRTRAAVSGTGGVLAFIKNLHARGTLTGSEGLKNGSGFNGVDPGTGLIGIGDKSCGIIAAAFVPRRTAMVITVGADGKCCIVNFTQASRKRAILLRAWYLRRPATSLSVICCLEKSALTQVDGANDEADSDSCQPSDEAYCVAIGREDGRVLLFDLKGSFLGEQKLGESETPVVDVEWSQVEGSGPGVEHRRSKPAISDAYDAHTDLRVPETIISSQPCSSTPESLEASEQYGGLFDFTPTQYPVEVVQQERPSSELNAAANHLDLIQADSEEMSSSETPSSSDSALTTPSDQTVHRKTMLGPGRRSPHASPNGPTLEPSKPPTVPPRPSPRPGGLLSIRRSHSAYESPTSDSYSTLIARARSAKNNMPLSDVRPFGPRPMPSRGGNNLQSPATSPDQPSSRLVVSDSSESLTPSHSHDLDKGNASPTTSVESFQTASTHFRSVSPSERSTDTVIDWDIGSTRQPIPSLDEAPQPPREEAPQMQSQTKGHISLSISSASLGTTPSSIFSAVNGTAGPIIQWPEASPRYSASGLHASHRPIENPAQPKAKQKAHVSILSSQASDDTVTSITSASESPVVQWPSLKKSPRIPELNKALSFSGRGSATGLVVGTFTRKLPSHTANSAKSLSPEKERSGSQVSSYSTRIESAMNLHLSSFRAEMVQKFDEQRDWLEHLIRSEDEGRLMLEEENRWLREELARVKEEKKRQSDE